MDTSAIVPTLLAALILITCPHEGKGYVSLDLDWSDFDQRLYSSDSGPWNRLNIQKRMAGYDGQDLSLPTGATPEINDDQKEIFHNEVNPDEIKADKTNSPGCTENCKPKSRRNIEGSYEENRNIPLSLEQKPTTSRMDMIDDHRASNLPATMMAFSRRIGCYFGWLPSHLCDVKSLASQ